jgi:hypothetical protein
VLETWTGTSRTLWTQRIGLLLHHFDLSLFWIDHCSFRILIITSTHHTSAHQHIVGSFSWVGKTFESYWISVACGFVSFPHPKTLTSNYDITPLLAISDFARGTVFPVQTD